MQIPIHYKHTTTKSHLLRIRDPEMQVLRKSLTSAQNGKAVPLTKHEFYQGLVMIRGL